MLAKIEIIGNLGKDPSMRFTSSGQAVTSFSVAASHKYTNAAGEKLNETTWFRVSAWGKQAETCYKYLKKGSFVYVEGRLTSDKGTGNPRIYQKSDGTSASSFEVIAQTVRFLSRSQNDEGEQSQNAAEIPAEDEVPF